MKQGVDLFKVLVNHFLFIFIIKIFECIQACFIQITNEKRKYSFSLSLHPLRLIQCLFIIRLLGFIYFTRVKHIFFSICRHAKRKKEK